VENCAEAIVIAAERAGDSSVRGQAFNIIDDNPPTQRRYARLLQKRLSPHPVIVPVAWSVMRSLAAMAVLTNRLLLRGRAKIPGIFVPARLHARCKPLRFDNALAKRALGWSPRYPLEDSLDRSFAAAKTVVSRAPTSPNPIEFSSPAEPIKGAA
jgi:nucleoside-diphosphate-sugar epimerase